MPTKLQLKVKVGEEWVDYSDAISNDYLWHRRESGCKWYADKLGGVVDAERIQLSCVTPTTVKNTNFLYAPQPEADVAPGIMLIAGIAIAIIGWLLWKKI